MLAALDGERCDGVTGEVAPDFPAWVHRVHRWILPIGMTGFISCLAPWCLLSLKGNHGS
jgi:hypothetical protein